MAAIIQQLPEAAVFIDAENHPDLDVSVLIERLDRFAIVERHAYADWRNCRLTRLAEQLECEDFDMHHTWSGRRCGAQKDKADGLMGRDMVRLVSRCPEIEAVIIVSGDAFFVHAVRQLQRQDKRVILAADPLRVSKRLHGTADEYLPLGDLACCIQGLHFLERTSSYLTFSFAVQKLRVTPSVLAELIRRGLVVQKKISRPGRGSRLEIYLNRHTYAVEAVLGTVA
jgi:uncharacterized LabA/DUF88 family protein